VLLGRGLCFVSVVCCQVECCLLCRWLSGRCLCVVCCQVEICVLSGRGLCIVLCVVR
jgi:hypothetical protein